MPPKPTGLAILVDEQRVNELLAQKSGAKAFIRSGFNVLLYMVFLYLFTTIALNEPRGKMRAFEGYVRRRFDSESAMPLREVESIADFWEYLNVTYLPAIYGNDTAKYYYPDATVPKMLQIEGANYLYGVARIRSLNVKANTDCLVPEVFKNDFSTCYGSFSDEAVDKTDFGPMTEDGVKSFRFRKDPLDEPYEGQLATYPTGGYMVVITPDYVSMKQRLQTVQYQGYISERTRAIFIDFTVYNFNLGLYAACHLAFEISPSGSWVKSFDVEVLLQRHLSALGAGSTDDWLALVAQAVLLLFVLRYILEETSEFIACEGAKGGIPRPSIKMTYFQDAWNILDWVNMVLIITTLTFKVLTWGKAGGLSVYIGEASKADVTDYTNFNGVINNVRLVHDLQAFNTILTWFKAVKYILVIPYVQTFMQTVSLSQSMLASWFVTFGMTLFGFVLAFCVAFGERVNIFRTPKDAFIFVMETFVGGGSSQVITDQAPFLGAVLLALYVLSFFFIVLNLFYAVIVSTLSEAKALEDARNAKTNAQLKERFKHFRDLVVSSLKLDVRFRSCFPGLYYRLMARKKKEDTKSKARDEAFTIKKQSVAHEDLMALGPGNPLWGRRPKRTLQSLSIEDAGISDDESEADLGPLRSQDQLSPSHTNSFNQTGKLSLGDVPSPAATIRTPLSEEDNFELVLDATRHIASGIVERSRGARKVLLAEMSESMEVLNNVALVLEVLGKRARDLEAQQKQVLKNV